MEESVFKALGLSVTLLAGYCFFLTSAYRRFRAEHLRPDRFAFHVLGVSVFLYAVGVLVASILVRHGAYEFARTVAEYTHLQAPVMCALILAPILGTRDSLYVAHCMRHNTVVAPLDWRHPFARMRMAAIARFIEDSDDAGIRLHWRALIYRKPLMLTLKSGKVYVGQPVEAMRDPSVRAHSIKIIPLYSGYRDEKTHKVELPTKYRDITSAIQLREKEHEPANPADPLARDLADLRTKDGDSIEIDIQDMGIVILWSEIQSLTMYDDNIYKAFQAMGPPPSKETPIVP